MSKDNIQTPNLDKILEVHDESQVCGEFLEFLQSKYTMFEIKASREDPFYYGAGDYINTEKLLADFFGIDLDEAERERSMILENLNKGELRQIRW